MCGGGLVIREEINTFRETFNKVLKGNPEPYPHQIEVFEHLSKNKLVILRAPTGSGKTESATVSHFVLSKNNWPNKLMYVLPMRSLVEDIAKRTQKWWPDNDFQLQHGKSNEDPFFRSSGVTTTIDQVMGAYSCAPLSSSLRQGNIPGGAVASSFLIFDEVQLLEPTLGLQCAYLLLQHAHNANMPAMLMSATLPESFIRHLYKDLDRVEIIDAKEKDIAIRKKRNVELKWKNKELSSEDIIQSLQTNEKLIVIVNRVDFAQELYKNVKSKIKKYENEPKIILLHSRFLPKDRNQKLKKIKEIFGKDSKKEENGILITTQVIEAGMDISTPCMISELSPIDSIIQRAGRCGRWGTNGEIIIYDTETPAPYNKELIESTKEKLVDLEKISLNWEKEKELVDSVLNDYASENWLDTKAISDVINLFTKAAFEGKREKVQQAIRNSLSVDLTIWNPDEPIKNPWELPGISFPFYSFKSFADENQIWEIKDVDNFLGEIGTEWEIYPSTETNPNNRYIIHPNDAAYSRDIGFELGENEIKEEPFEPQSKNKEDLKDNNYLNYKNEEWSLHTDRTLNFAVQELQEYRYTIKKLSEKLGIEQEKIHNDIKITIALHDLGKLNKKWQKRVGGNSKKWLAHTEKETEKLPPHSTVSAEALWGYFYYRYKENGTGLEEVFPISIAHHHSLRSSNYPSFSLIDNWYKEIKKIDHNINFDEDFESNIITEKKHSGNLPNSFIDPHNRNLAYRLYLIISRILRLSDQHAVKMLKEEKVC